MKNLLLPVVLGCALLASCPGATRTADQAYVAADRSTYELIAPIISALADEDPGNDPDLSGANGASLLMKLESWELRIRTAEEGL